MVGKRKTTARAPATLGRRGRPRSSTRSTYATQQEEEVDDAIPQEQPSEPQGPETQGTETHQPQGATPEQELQQLQAQLQRAQEERDRMAAAFAASQKAAQTSAQVAEIRQQLAILHAEMLSMQHMAPASTSATPASAETPGASAIDQPAPIATPDNTEAY